MESEIISSISQVGFPIAMCVYLMFRFERTIKENTKMIQKLGELIRGLKK